MKNSYLASKRISVRPEEEREERETTRRKEGRNRSPETWPREAWFEFSALEALPSIISQSSLAIITISAYFALEHVVYCQCVLRDPFTKSLTDATTTQVRSYSLNHSYNQFFHPLYTILLIRLLEVVISVSLSCIMIGTLKVSGHAKEVMVVDGF